MEKTEDWRRFEVQIAKSEVAVKKKQEEDKCAFQPIYTVFGVHSNATGSTLDALLFFC